MTLRGSIPSDTQRRAKVLLFGKPSSGKTTTCLDFPNLYYIDCEKGAVMPSYIKKMQERGIHRVFMNTYYELADEFRNLISVEHDFHTVAVDPLTVVFHAMIEESTRRLAEFTGKDIDDPELAEYGKDRKSANMKMRHLVSLLTRLDMNVIVTCHEKVEFKTEKPTFDCYGKLDYMFDLAFELTVRGDKYMATVRKTRHENFKFGETFEWSYDTFADRYGRESLERQAVARQLADESQVARLLELLKAGESHYLADSKKNLVTEKDLSTWMAKAGVEDWHDAQEEHVTKLISFLEKKLEC